MIRYLPGSPASCFALLAVLAVGLLPAASEGAVLAFRNDTDSPVMVQGMSVINRVVRRGKLHVLQPGEVGRELILVPGNKLIIVADAKQLTRILCQETIQFTANDLFFSIQPDVPDKAKEADNAASKLKGRKPVTPKVKLVPSKPAPPPPAPTPSKPRR